MPPLDFDSFRRALKRGEIGPAYYFHGSEELLKDDAVRDLLSAVLEPGTRDFNLDRRRTADVAAEDFSTLTLTPPMMAPRRAVVLTETEVLLQRRPKAQALRTAILSYLAKPSPETLLILVHSGDERPDADLVRAAAAVEFAPLHPERLEKWIRHRAEREGLQLDDDGAKVLREAVGDDLAQLAAEIGKLRGAIATGTATAGDVADLVGVRHGETLHDLVDAVTARQFQAALDMLRHVAQSPGTSGVRVVGALATALVGVGLARSQLDAGRASGAVTRELLASLQSARPFGLRRYTDEAARWVADARGWTRPEVDRALAELLKADRRLKGTTLGGDVEIVADALLAIAGAARVAA
jgi:DNA polymerase III subunit delta